MVEKGRLEFVGEVERVLGDRSHVKIYPRYSEALDGITSFSHIIILYWLHLRDTEERRRTLRVTPRRHRGAPESGVFATRSPDRPNPIGFNVSKLVRMEGSLLVVRDLDAVEGTPIVDIKPYIPRADCVPEARAPEWTLHGPRT